MARQPNASWLYLRASHIFIVGAAIEGVHGVRDLIHGHRLDLDEVIARRIQSMRLVDAVVAQFALKSCDGFVAFGTRDAYGV
jgi:hypothetical protein